MAQLLDINAEYLRKAQRGALVKIAPRRFNPNHEAWLPVLHTERDGLRFTALFSNTARAHQLGTTREWVVIYWGRDHQESQCTVVTELERSAGRPSGGARARGRVRQALPAVSLSPRGRGSGRGHAPFAHQLSPA